MWISDHSLKMAIPSATKRSTACLRFNLSLIYSGCSWYRGDVSNSVLKRRLLGMRSLSINFNATSFFCSTILVKLRHSLPRSVIGVSSALCCDRMTSCRHSSSGGRIGVFLCCANLPVVHVLKFGNILGFLSSFSFSR